MIKARELMIANYVKAENNLCMITCVNIDYCVGYGVDTNVFYSSPFLDCLFEPIPLTEEWLLKFGFKKTWFGYEYKTICLSEISNGCYPVSFDDDGTTSIGKNINHVHSLQNLCFALTGEELTFK